MNGKIRKSWIFQNKVNQVVVVLLVAPYAWAYYLHID